MKVNDKTVLLTGASGGIGKAIAVELAKRGAWLVLTGRNEVALNKLKNALENPSRHEVMVADINNASDRKLLTVQCGHVDILINNAGISDFEFLEYQREDVIEKMFTTNLLSPVYLTRMFLPILQNKKEAAVVNIGSSFGSIGFPGFASYCASKFGLHGFTEALRRELADTKVKVLYVAPRATKTDINKMSVVTMNEALGNAMDDPEVVARIVADAIEKKSIKDKFIGWPENLFVRINALLPALVDSNLKKQLATIKQHADVKSLEWR